MALPTTLSAAKLSVWIGSSSSPGTFVAPCGLNTLDFSINVTTNDITVPDCDDPDLPAWVARAVQNLSSTINGSGVLAMEALPTWREFAMSTEGRMCRIIIDASDITADAGYFQGVYLVTTFRITGTLGNKIQIELSLNSDGQVTWTADSP